MEQSRFEAPTQEPFATEPAQLKGCGKPAVIGCLVLLLLVVAGLVALMWKAQDILAFAVDEYRAAVESSLPDELPAQERERLARAFDAALVAIREGRVEPADAQRLQRVLSSPPRPGERMKRERILELIEALEALADDDSPGRQDAVPAPAEPVAASLAFS